MIKIYWFWTCDELGKWLQHVSPSWDMRLYGFRPRGKSDLLYFMGMYALITGDVKVIKACIKLINELKRWPDSMNHDCDAKTKFRWRWSNLWKRIVRDKKSHLNKFGVWCEKKGIPVLIKYRTQNSLTRDPITTILCAVYFHQYELIQDIKIPPKLYRPSFHNWVKYLKTNEIKYKKRYEWWQIFEIRTKIKYPAYVKTLNGFRAWIAKSDKVKAEIFLHTEPWNLLHRLLCNDFVDGKDIDLYIPTEGFIFNSDTLPDSPVELTEHEPFVIDKEILRFLYDNKNW